MIRVAIRAVAEQRGITTAYQLQKALGVPPATAAQLWKGEGKRIDLGTLDKLCSVLKCRPNDLLKFEPDAK
jgi:DNA-binding Xre family transcriptional regulator